MKSSIFFLFLLASSLYAEPLAKGGHLDCGRPDYPTIIREVLQDAKELSTISFTITYSEHETADYSKQAQAMSDALTAAGAKVRLQRYNSKTREGVYGYYGAAEAEKIDTVKKLTRGVLDVKFEHSKAFDEPGANPNRMIMIYLIRNKTT